jgi:ribosomal protein L35AE/L33A
MYAWHTPLVCAFYLQHRSMYQPRSADGQYRLLQLFVDRGIGAVHAVARGRVARNHGSKPALSTAELARYEGLPARSFPAVFGASVHVLREKGGGFVSQGHTAYEDRMRSWAQATIDGWKVAPRVC